MSIPTNVIGDKAGSQPLGRLAQNENQPHRTNQGRGNKETLVDDHLSMVTDHRVVFKKWRGKIHVRTSKGGVNTTKNKGM